jgi:maltose O-acetyltransferase
MSRFSKIWQVLREEATGVHPRLQAFTVAQSVLPRRGAGQARARLFRAAGFRVGSGSRIDGCPRITGHDSLQTKISIGERCSIAEDCVFDLSEVITIGDGVTLGPGTMILTSTHEMASAQHRAGNIITSPVTIGAGALLGARCVILPGANLGEGCVVDAGSVVNKEVPPHTRVGGIPAVTKENLRPSGS